MRTTQTKTGDQTGDVFDVRPACTPATKCSELEYFAILFQFYSLLEMFGLILLFDFCWCVCLQW